MVDGRTMKRRTVLLCVIALSTAATGAWGAGQYGRAVCYFVDAAGRQTPRRQCMAFEAGNAFENEGAIWLGNGARYSSSVVTNNDDGTTSHRRPVLHNLAAPFAGQRDDLMCAPVASQPLRICATSMEDSGRPPPAY